MLLLLGEHKIIMFINSKFSICIIKKLKTIARTKLVDYPVVDKTPARTEVL